MNDDVMSDEPTLENVRILLLNLRLKHWADALAGDAEQLTPIERKLLLRLVAQWAKTEIARRKNTLIASRIKAAKFKKLQTIDGFDFSYNRSTKLIQKTYLELLHSIGPDTPPSAVFAGTAGLGKTRLARSLGYAACQKGLAVLFMSCAEIVNNLATAQKAFCLEAELRKYRRPSVLIIDELGYVTMAPQESNLFFQVISARHDQGLGTIVTTNLPFGKYNQIFANDAIAHVIVDRLVADAEVFYLEGESYRETEKKLKKTAVSKKT
jgi:DNA replication protein DnaC